ncbi:ANKRD6 [Branchiostoma lanceolatum]|uniref:ANKRD6 protein n=1 Tax=Branchiostoma lanceolatum TaxID=7740 RepID=A0A8J9VXD9_BRALA|nr:ANKRD6 [Branchiostoma lanceolatum]
MACTTSHRFLRYRLCPMSADRDDGLAEQLFYAVAKGQTDRVVELIQAGARLFLDKHGHTVLHVAAHRGFTNTLKVLLQAGCELDIQDNDGCTALHRAVVGGHVEVVQALIEEGASVDRQDQNGNTPLHEAAWNGYSRTVELLIRARANIHAKNENGFTPLHHAVQNGHSQSCRMLLMGGCMPDARNNYGDTALHLAIKYGHVTGTRILLSARCHVNQRNKDGRTALHIAANLGLRKLTKILVEANADVNAKDKDGKTPIDLARDKENPECILIMTSTPKGKRSGRGRSTHRKDNSNIKRSHSLPADGTNKGKEQTSQQRKDKPVKRVQIQTGPDKHTKKHSPSIQVKSTPHLPKYKESQDRLRHRHHQHQHHHQHNPHHPHHPHHVHPHYPQQQQGIPAVKGGRGPHPPAQVPPHLLPQAFPHMYHMVRDQKGQLQKIPVYQCYGCTPYLQQMENKLEAHREELLAEIDDSHWALNSQMQQVERKCSHHAACLDQLCRERVSAEQTACLHRIDKRATQDRRELAADTDTKVKSVRESLHAWMEQKYSDLQERLDRVTLSDQDVYRESQPARTTDRTWAGTSNVAYPLEKAQSEGVLDSRSIFPPTEHNHLHPTDDEKLGTVMWVSDSNPDVFPRGQARGHTAWEAAMSDGVSRSGDGLSTRHHGHPYTGSQQLSHLWQDPPPYHPPTKDFMSRARSRASSRSSLPAHGSYARVQDISPSPLHAAETGFQMTRSKEQSANTQAGRTLHQSADLELQLAKSKGQGASLGRTLHQSADAGFQTTRSKEQSANTQASRTSHQQYSSPQDRQTTHPAMLAATPTPIHANEPGFQLARPKEQSVNTQASRTSHQQYSSLREGRTTQPAATTPTYTTQTSFMPKTNQFSLSSDELYRSQYRVRTAGDLCVDDSAISCDKSVSTSYLSYGTGNNDDSVLQTTDSSHCTRDSSHSSTAVSEQNSLRYTSVGRRVDGRTEDDTRLPPDVHAQLFSTQGSHV